MLSILNYAAAPFGSEENLFLVNGVEGVHYELNDGVPIANDRGKSEIAVIPFLAGAAPVAFYDVPGDAQYMQKILLDLLINAIDDPTSGLYPPANVKMGPHLAQSVSDKIVAIVTGCEQLSAWDAFLEDYNSRSNDQVRKEYPGRAEGAITKGIATYAIEPRPEAGAPRRRIRTASQHRSKGQSRCRPPGDQRLAWG